MLRQLPAPLARLPRHLRWMLGREIRARLAAGWRPDQILEVLAAPMPADVQRPWRLALWRLRHNVVGAGPRLRPLQQAWDAQASAQAKATADDTTARWYADVAAVTSAERACRAALRPRSEVRAALHAIRWRRWPAPGGGWRGCSRVCRWPMRWRAGPQRSSTGGRILLRWSRFRLRDRSARIC